MYLPDISFPHIRREYLCPLDHPDCGPGPTIGVTSDPPTFGPQSNIARNIGLMGSERNVIGIVLTTILLLVALAIYVGFGKWPRQKLEAWQERKQKKRQDHCRAAVGQKPLQSGGSDGEIQEEMFAGQQSPALNMSKEEDCA